MRRREVAVSGTVHEVARYQQHRATVPYRRSAEVVDVRYLSEPEPVRRNRKPVPEWVKILGFCVLRIMPPLLVTAAIVVLVCTVMG